MARITAETDGTKGLTYVLSHDRPVTLGRDYDVDLVLVDPLVSRRHLLLEKSGKHFFVQDKKSRHGTKVNKKQLAGRQRLADGDRLQVGATTFVYSRDAGGRPAPEEIISQLGPKPFSPGLAMGRALVQRRLSHLPVKGNLGDPETVLIADPDAATLSQLESRLHRDGFWVRTVRNGPALLDLAVGAPPALIIADVLLQGLDCFTLFQELQATPVTAKVPVIFTSASAASNPMKKAMEMGALDYQYKPVNLEQLAAKIKSTLEEKRAAVRAARRADPGVRGSLTETSFPDLMKSLVMGDRSALLEVVREADGRRARFYLANGRLFFAEAPPAFGAQAFYKVFRWSKGAYTVMPLHFLPGRNLAAPLDALVAKAEKIKQEMRRAGVSDEVDWEILD